MFGPNDDALCECQNCDWTGKVAELRCDLSNIPDLFDRIAPGEIVPAGTCPECDSLCHLVES